MFLSVARIIRVCVCVCGVVCVCVCVVVCVVWDVVCGVFGVCGVWYVRWKIVYHQEQKEHTAEKQTNAQTRTFSSTNERRN
jgi:hypothetical protein